MGYQVAILVIFVDEIMGDGNLFLFCDGMNRPHNEKY